MMFNTHKSKFYVFVLFTFAIGLSAASTTHAGVTTITFSASTNPADYTTGESVAAQGEVDVSDSDLATANFGTGPTNINGWLIAGEVDPYSIMTSANGTYFESSDAGGGDNAMEAFYMFPSGVTPSDVTNIRIRARVSKNNNTDDAWFYLFDWTDDRYLVLGNGQQITGSPIGTTLTDIEINLTDVIPSGDVPGDYLNTSQFNGVLFLMIDQDTSNRVRVDFIEMDIYYTDPDADGDGIADLADNCPLAFNPGQENNDGDAPGDACDSDDDNDTLSDVDEAALGTNPFSADSDSDQVPDLFEVGIDIGNPVDTDVDSVIDALDTDDDGDGILTSDEDLDADSDPTNDDTDSDGTPNYLDNDDDGDEILTSNEDLDADSDPTNDDLDSDGVPNYLDEDDDADGLFTSDEIGADPFNPEDLDEDTFPSYLDNCEIPGDFNADNVVSDADWTVWADHYGDTGTSWSTGDANSSSTTSDADWTIWADHYSDSCTPL